MKRISTILNDMFTRKQAAKGCEESSSFHGATPSWTDRDSVALRTGIGEDRKPYLMKF